MGSIGVYALWLFVAISLLLPFPQMVYKAVAGRELFQQQSKFSVMNLVDLAQKNQKAVDNKSDAGRALDRCAAYRNAQHDPDGDHFC